MDHVVDRVAGGLGLAPLLLVWAAPPSFRIHRRQYAEGMILLTLLILVTWYVFGSIPPDGILHQALIYVIFPFVIWAAIRLGQHGATLAVFVVSDCHLNTVQGWDRFRWNRKTTAWFCYRLLWRLSR
jgi:integral membrane sensor domain MASE1